VDRVGHFCIVAVQSYKMFFTINWCRLSSTCKERRRVWRYQRGN